MCNEIKSLLTILAGLLTPTLAAFGLWIAWRQSQTAKEKIKLDLFDRRFSIFEKFSDTLLAILQHGDAKDGEIRILTQVSHTAPLLFPDEFAKKIEGWRKSAIVLNGNNIAINQYLDESGSREASIKSKYEILREFGTLYECLGDEFKNVMKPHH
jgi:hypothetical protein